MAFEQFVPGEQSSDLRASSVTFACSLLPRKNIYIKPKTDQRRAYKVPVRVFAIQIIDM